MKPTSRHSMVLENMLNIESHLSKAREVLRAIEIEASNARCILEITKPATIERSIRQIDRKTGSLKRRNRKGVRHA